MTLLGLTFGMLDILLIGVFLLAMIVSVSFDRRGTSEPKWIATVLGVGALLFFTRDSWTLASLMSFVLSAEFWVPLLKYLGAGFLYTIVEFIRGVRISKREITEAWESFLETNVKQVLGSENIIRNSFRNDEDDSYFFTGKVRDLFAAAEKISADTQDDGEKRTRRLANIARQQFVGSGSFARSHVLVRPVLNSQGQIEATANRAVIALNVGAWVLFWPFYFLSLIIGDLLAEVFATFADYLSTIGGRYIRSVFKDVFKF